MSGPDRQVHWGDERSTPIDELVGAGLRQRREERSLSIMELAFAAAVDANDIVLWESGRARIPAHTLLLLIELLELDPPWFFESLHEMKLARYGCERN